MRLHNTEKNVYNTNSLASFLASFDYLLLLHYQVCPQKI